MSKIEAKKIVKRYANKLTEKKYPFSAIYLFGSCVNGKPKKWSDIDVAVVTNKLNRNYNNNRFKLWDLRLDVDTRIEPHGFTEKEFKEDWNPMVHEIKKTGIKIA